MAKEKAPIKKFIGRSDRIDLPEMDLFEIEAKVDTGAYTSAIHCHDIEEGEDAKGPFLEFVLLDKKHPAYNNKKFRVRNFNQKVIKNSFGQKEVRYVIKTPVQIFDLQLTTEFTLSNRKRMKFPVLLGRKFLQKHFVVEVSKHNLSYKQKRKKI